MADFVIAQREFFQDGPYTASPAVVPNTGRYANWTFAATTVTAVEGTVDGVAYVDITALALAASPAGTKVFQDICFKAYRVTYTGTLRVNAN